MTPVVLASEIFQILLEEGPHVDDAIRHPLDLPEPLLLERGIIEDLGCNTSSMDRWVGVKRADQDLDLGVHPLLLFGRLTDN